MSNRKKNSSIQSGRNLCIGCSLWWLRPDSYLHILCDSRWFRGHANRWPHDRADRHEPKLFQRHHSIGFSSRMHHGLHCACYHRAPDAERKCRATKFTDGDHNVALPIHTIVTDVRMAHCLLDYVFRAYSENNGVHNLGIS